VSTATNFSAQTLFNLLPAILRIRDQSQAVVSPGWLPELADRAKLKSFQATIAAGGSLTVAQAEQFDQLQQQALAGPLANLLAVVAEQVGVLEEDLDQLYDDQFIETCADWVVPYIGDLIGYRTLHSSIPGIASPRAEVAHTIAYRRRKGTVVVLEQLARDVTGWNATAKEFFTQLVMTQYMNHLRPQCVAAPDLRQWEPLERLGGAFDSIIHTVDVRRIASERGKYNIPTVGLFLWRIEAWPLSCSPAVPAVSGDNFRFRFHPLNIDQPLYTLPQAEATITQLATPLNVPEPISRRVLDTRLADYYSSGGIERSLRLQTKVGPGTCAQFTLVDSSKILVCNLSDDAGTWAHAPAAGEYKIDPVLGRLWLPPDVPAGTQVRVDFHYGFSADLGGGEYARADTFQVSDPPPPMFSVPDAFPTITAALAALTLQGGGGIIEITDSGRYEETVALNVPAGERIELRAADRCRPTLVLSGPMNLNGGGDAEIHLNGLLITGTNATCLLHVPAAGNGLARLHINHCTLVPGWALAQDCTPRFPDQPNLVAEPLGLAIIIQRSIIGPIRTRNGASNSVTIADSIVDATSTSRIAYAGLSGDVGGTDPGAALSLDACTVIGKIHARTLPLVSNSILLAALATADAWTAPIIAVRRQQGCVRFTWLPATARVPRRYQCLPESADSPMLAAPRFTSLRYGFPAYAQLSTQSGAQLLTGADDESQPGAFHYLYPPQRETNLRVRLDEYLRVGLEAGIFYQS
jgi:hypothetical protein